MELILKCRECSHEEHGEAARALMLKVRMLNHLNKAHPELVEPFRETVEEYSVVTRA